MVFGEDWQLESAPHEEGPQGGGGFISARMTHIIEKVLDDNDENISWIWSCGRVVTGQLEKGWI